MIDTNHTNSPDSSSNAAPAPLPGHKNPLARLISHLNLTQLTLAIFVVVFVWQWLDGKHQLNQIQQTLAQRLSDVDGSNKANQTLTLQSQELVRELGGKLSVLESKYAETQSQRTALENLYHDLSSSRDQMVLAEAEQLLLIAGQQLHLAANVKAALIAMQQADSRLQRLDRAALNGLRRAISSDMDKLRALPDVDVSAINARLDQLITLVNHLPLVRDIRAKEESIPAAATNDEGKLSTILRDIWQEARDLVRIENTHSNELPLVSPTQTFFLRENLKLRLLSARIALLSRDETSFHHDIKTAQEWVKIYFDTKSGDGVLFTSTLQKLSSSSIKIHLPDISGSLEAVRHYRASREKVTR